MRSPRIARKERPPPQQKGRANANPMPAGSKGNRTAGSSPSARNLSPVRSGAIQGKKNRTTSTGRRKKVRINDSRVQEGEGTDSPISYIGKKPIPDRRRVEITGLRTTQEGGDCIGGHQGEFIRSESEGGSLLLKIPYSSPRKKERFISRRQRRRPSHRKPGRGPGTEDFPYEKKRIFNVSLRKKRASCLTGGEENFV